MSHEDLGFCSVPERSKDIVEKQIQTDMSREDLGFCRLPERSKDSVEQQTQTDISHEDLGFCSVPERSKDSVEKQIQTDISHEDLGLCRVPENETETNGLTQNQGSTFTPNCEVNQDVSACNDQNERVEGTHKPVTGTNCRTRRYPQREKKPP